jgi:hypothetical protein
MSFFFGNVDARHKRKYRELRSPFFFRTKTMENVWKRVCDSIGGLATGDAKEPQHATEWMERPRARSRQFVSSSDWFLFLGRGRHSGTPPGRPAGYPSNVFRLPETYPSSCLFFSYHFLSDSPFSRLVFFALNTDSKLLATLYF